MKTALALVFVVIACACRSTSTGPYNPPDAAARNTVEAERLTHSAGDVVECDAKQAEQLLREALTQDIYYGPAHNNLGVLFLKQDKLYEASIEFEWARKLMPGHPDPRVNLAITLERAGKLDEALAGYSAALEVAPEYVPAIEGLACLSMRMQRTEPRLVAWLERIALETDDPNWREWARSSATSRAIHK